MKFNLRFGTPTKNRCTSWRPWYTRYSTPSTPSTPIVIDLYGKGDFL